MAHLKKPLRVKRRLFAMISSTALALAMTSAVLAEDGARDVEFEIQPQALQSALLAFSEQAGVQLILAADTKGLRFSASLLGKMDAQQALAELIKGTDLEFHFTSDNTVTIRKKVQPQPEQRASLQAAAIRQTEESAPTNRIEEIVSVGTRSKGRTATQTPVPVDVVSARALASTGHTEVGRMLQTLAPSFNFSSSSVSDGTDALRPATLRGLGPDQTLVLVNGKRRHTSALVHVNTSVGRGAAGVDMNAVPAAALGRIEVLRDGAAAQYGSDAIAGVINLVLRENADGGEISASYGQAYQGDGATIQVSANTGFALGDGGFLNFSADFRDRGYSNRAGLSGTVQYPLLDNGGACDAIDNSACDPREFTFDRENFRIGDAESEQKALMANMKLPLGDHASLYSFLTFSDRVNQSAGFYRRANQYERTVLDIYPDGFLPLINTNIEDYSLTSGFRTLAGGFDLDLSVNHGANNFNFVISNSLNASLGAASPTQADAGTLSIRQTVINLDAVKQFDISGREVTFAFGAEYRRENYMLEAGEEASYASGGALNFDCLGCAADPILYDAGFQVFRGFSPENAVDASRHNMAMYLDVEAQVSERLLVTAAARIEDYSDFGTRVSGKTSARFEVSDAVAVRASLATGFRAPSMQQKNFNSVSTQFVEIDGVTVPQERGTFRNDSDVARRAGVPLLEEETSVSISAGIVAKSDRLTVTADYYHIAIDDRVGISGAIDLTQSSFSNLNSTASSAQFFVNAADTKTNGVDIVATYDVALPMGHTLHLSAAANWTETTVVASSVVSSIGGVNVGPLITAQDISIIEDWQPKSRVNVSATYNWGGLELISRLSQYGSYRVCEGACNSMDNTQRFSAKWLADFQLSYRVQEGGLRFTIGANNIFDTKPDLNQIGQSRGGDILGIVSSPGVFQYSRRSAPFGFNGGYWYARATYQF
jgi:iron complex outermembrane receptor protein